MHIQAWIWWQGILLQSQFSLFLCILKLEAYAQKLDRSKTPAQLHIMNWHPDWFTTTNLPYKFPIFWTSRRRLVRYYWYLCMEGISSLPWYDEANPVQLAPVVPARGGA